jgi:hypothetical protein
MHATSGSTASMCSILWATTLTDCPPSSMPSRPDSILLSPPREHQPLSRAARQDRLLFRLGPRGAHLRPSLLSLDTVGLREDVQLYYDNDLKKAQPIDKLIEALRAAGHRRTPCGCSDDTVSFTAEWKAMSEKEKSDDADELPHRLSRARRWSTGAPELGTVLANDEVVEGLSACVAASPWCRRR